MLTDLSLDPADSDPKLIVEAARRAEASGLDGVWVYDHMSGAALGGSTTSDPWPLLGAMAVATRRISLGPLVTNVTVRNPAHVAVAAATLQALSGGRFLLGVGAGAGPESPFSEELRMVGLRPKGAAERRRMVSEAIAVIRLLWTGGGSVEGAHFSTSEAIGFPIPEPSPPIIVGSNGPRMSQLAGARGDGVNLHSHEPDLAGLIEIVRSSAHDRVPIITVEAPLERSWLDGEDRVRMEQLGVDRLVLRWHGGSDRLSSIDAAGRVVAGG